MKYTITGFSEKFGIPKDEVIKNLNTTYKAYVTKERGRDDIRKWRMERTLYGVVPG